MLDKFRSYLKSSRRPAVGPEHKQRIANLEGIIGFKVDDPFLYVKALQHRSILADDNYSESDSYERLEFLGDAVLDLIITEVIFDRYPDENEGFLTKLRAKLVRGDMLAHYARKLQLNELLVIGERAQGQGIELSKSVLADVFEALVGAIYLDRDYEMAARFVEKVIGKHVEFDRLVGTMDNYKSELLELAQARQLEIPRYEVISETGPGHNKTFTVKAIVDDIDRGTGTGKSKKEAEQRAAKEALKVLRGL